MSASKKDFLKLVNDHISIIYSLCSIYYKEAEDKKDAQQDIIYQLWKSYPSFKGQSAWSTWIYRVSLNTILSKVAKEKKRLDTDSIADNCDHITRVNTFCDDDLQLLKKIIEMLKPVDKALVVLYLEGYKNKEMAEMLQLSQTNVNTRLSRIKTQLKLKFDRYSNETR